MHRWRLAPDRRPGRSASRGCRCHSRTVARAGTGGSGRCRLPSPLNWRPATICARGAAQAQVGSATRRSSAPQPLYACAPTRAQSSLRRCPEDDESRAPLLPGASGAARCHHRFEIAQNHRVKLHIRSPVPSRGAALLGTAGSRVHVASPLGWRRRCTDGSLSCCSGICWTKVSRKPRSRASCTGYPEWGILLPRSGHQSQDKSSTEQFRTRPSMMR